jgi:hypothetical protein
MSIWQLRYRLLDRYADFVYCDPDLYPVARDDETAAATQWWAAHRLTTEASAILGQRGYHEPLSPSQQLVAYRDHKKLTVIVMTPTGGGYRYTLSVSTKGQDEPDETVTGTITLTGALSEVTRVPRIGGCPICLEAATRIATPSGDRLVTSIAVGDWVWTLDASGHKLAAPVERIIRRPTPGPHLMVELGLADGRELIAAGAHPDVSGHALRELRVGQPYDGSTVASIAWLASTSVATYDILPSGPTGAYWANGILIGSTLISLG